MHEFEKDLVSGNDVIIRMGSHEIILLRTPNQEQELSTLQSI